MKTHMRNLPVKFILVSVFLLPSVALAHPGRTDAYGCHTCKTNCPKWGLSYNEYHCHNSKGLPQPFEPIKSHKSDSGIGYTTPAPEYKIPKVAVVEKKTNPAPKPIQRTQESWLGGMVRKFGF